MEEIDTGGEWELLMRAGDFAGAWLLSDRVLARGTPHDCARPRHLQSVWTGASFAGKRVLVRCYHGLGDTIQFARFARILRAQAAEVTLWVQPALLPLAAAADGVDRVEPLTENAPVAAYDIDIEIMELAHALRAQPQDIAAGIPYLWPVAPPPAKAAALLNACGTVLRVGIVWRGSAWDGARDIPPALLEPLADVPGVRLFSFQPHAGDAAERLGAADLGALNVVEIASVLPRIGLVISTDTMLAHLAGAMGRPVWTLLAAESDWRWMNARADTPWYPTMRLFRQRQPGDWAGVIERARAALAHLAAGRNTPVPA